MTNQFLEGLKVGDQVVVRDRYLSEREYGPRIYRVEYITPKRSRFDLIIKGGLEMVSFDKNGCRRTGGGWHSETFVIEPVSPGIGEEIAKDSVLILLNNRRQAVGNDLLKMDLTQGFTHEERQTLLNLLNQIADILCPEEE
jgi:hypothetical protein